MISEYLKKAEQGDVLAQNNLADFYYSGHGVEKNYIQAVNWYRRVADYVFPPDSQRYFEYSSRKKAQLNAQYKLADCYFQGLGVEKNTVIAIEWLTKAAEQNHALAQIQLADCYFEGNGIEKDSNKGIEWFKNASKYYSEEFSEYYDIHGHHDETKLPKDLSPINHRDLWNTGGRTEDELLALHKLAIRYYFGKGVEQNYIEAVKCLEKINNPSSKFSVFSDYASTYAKTELGICYYYGHGVEKNYDKALKLFEESAQQKYAFGCLWQAYLIYIINKPVAEQLSPLDRLSRLQGLSATGISSLTEIEIKRHRELSEKVNGVINNEQKIDKALHMAAASLVLQENDVCSYNIDIINFYFTDAVLNFLEEKSKIILAFYFQFKNDGNNSLAYFEKAEKENDIVASYELGKHYKKIGYFEKSTGYFETVEKRKINPFNDKKKFSQEKYEQDTVQWLSLLAKEELRNIDNIKHQKELEEKNKELQKSKEVIERMMGRFEHSFRTPINSIISSFNHKTNLKLCKQNAQVMLGMLEIIKIMSTDDELLKKDLICDKKGNGNILSVLIRVIDNILLDLLSVSSVVKIQQHYIAYAKASGRVDYSVDSDSWEQEHFCLEQELQIKWEQEFSLLVDQQSTLRQRLDWITEHFFVLNLVGFDDLNLQFRDYSIKDSFLSILLTEIILNTFKYYSSKDKEPVFLEWAAQGDYQVLTCRNPSSRDVYMQPKGSQNGHEFMSVLANKTGGKFLSHKLQDDFSVEFSIPNIILGIENELFLMD